MVGKRYRLIAAELRDSRSFQRDFKQLLSLTEGQISKLAAIGESEYGFNLLEESIGDAATNLEVEDQEVGRILTVARYLYSRASTEGTYEESAKEICDFAETLGIKDCDAKISAIRRLLTKKEAYEYSTLVTYTETSAAPVVSDVDVACDIRAVVDPKTDDIVGYVPIALVSIDVEQSPSDKRTVTFQLSEKDVVTLLDELNKAKRLLESLRDKFGGKIVTT